MQRYDTVAAKWLPDTLIYALDADTQSVTDLSRIEGNRFVVVERDEFQGDAAKAKRVYSIDLDKPAGEKAPADKSAANKPLAKKLVIDLLSIGNARGIAESLAPGTPFRAALLATVLAPCLFEIAPREIVWIDYFTVAVSLVAGAGLLLATEWLLANGAAARQRDF